MWHQNPCLRKSWVRKKLFYFRKKEVYWCDHLWARTQAMSGLNTSSMLENLSACRCCKGNVWNINFVRSFTAPIIVGPHLVIQERFWVTYYIPGTVLRTDTEVHISDRRCPHRAYLVAAKENSYKAITWMHNYTQYFHLFLDSSNRMDCSFLCSPIVIFLFFHSAFTTTCLVNIKSGPCLCLIGLQSTQE